MRFNRLDLNLLVVLDALLTECNITRAGEKVHLSQSATSGALGRLREFFEDELLVQIGRKMVLTPLGESLVTPVRSILIQIQTTVEQRPNFDPGRSDRRFTLVMSDYTATVLMPEVIRAASELAPSVSFELMTPSDAPVDELESGNADFLLLPSNFVSDEHPSLPIFDEDFVCVCWRDNPMVGDSIDIDTYLRLGHVMVRFGSQRRPSVDEWLTHRYGIERRAEIVATNFSAVPHYLLGTPRLATMHRRLAHQWAEYLPLKILPAPMDIPVMSWSLQWHQYRNLDPGTQWMRDLIRDTAVALAP